ncbi:hypothetical protein DV735_g4816, partial [Chaetothyriales sp. CBS 134920]
MSASTSTLSSVASTTSASASASATSNGGGGGGGTSSPLLFFVALGFGVVFTNLWIIVGVKYCFRYNQRNRLRMQAEGEDAVDLNAMPRQHRRRREKKLMTMDEVNEKFPLTKYKIWRATRAENGLPTAGGIVATATSRAPSIIERRESTAESKAEDLHRTTSVSILDEKLPNQAASELHSAAAEPSSPRPKTAQSSHGPAQNLTHLPEAGDACAICIDTIDDDDDADYYVHKPRPEGQDAQGSRGTPQIPPGAFVVGAGGRRPTVVLPARVVHIVYPDRHHGVSDIGNPPRLSRAERRRLEREERERSAGAAAALDQAHIHQVQSQTEVGRLQALRTQLLASLKLDVGMPEREDE